MEEPDRFTVTPLATLRTHNNFSRSGLKELKESFRRVTDVQATMSVCVSGQWVEGVGIWQNTHSQGYFEDKSKFGSRGKDGHEAWRSTFPFSLFFSLTQTPECPQWLVLCNGKEASPSPSPRCQVAVQCSKLRKEAATAVCYILSLTPGGTKL